MYSFEVRYFEGSAFTCRPISFSRWIQNGFLKLRLQKKDKTEDRFRKLDGVRPRAVPCLQWSKGERLRESEDKKNVSFILLCSQLYCTSAALCTLYTLLNCQIVINYNPCHLGHGYSSWPQEARVP